ncbi:MAG: ABC transporter ATP-binding protein [Anaerolineales bacterium]|nr:ABC transporter ATP-binding protein [Anaerolineales bacterium]MCX7608023.1 ABC transporter ATP-binding protein [Anaerolineales bacterium]MDW8227511.1 ABC transporter ATP-binding protein [Anaerolineales bacterium]
MLRLQNVSKIYRIGAFGGKELHAVSGVSFELPAKMIVALIGESGSGKSTIGKMILRLTPVSSGKIEFEGQDIALLKGAALKNYYRQVQGVFQDPFSSYNPIFKADRIFEIVHRQFFPHINANAWQEKVERTLWEVGLNPEHVLNKYPHQLSGGQLQRFLVARALLLDIRLLIADEIISMLDASTRIDVLNLLSDLKSRGLSVLFITHDLSLANYLSDRAVILYRGCITEMGATWKIFQAPLHPYTQMLIEAVPRIDKKWTPGLNVEANHIPTQQVTDCPYRLRCPLADRQCLQRPPLVEIEPDHQVACWKVEKRG